MLSLLSVVKPKSANENTKLTLFLHYNYKTGMAQHIKYFNCVYLRNAWKTNRQQCKLSDHGIWPSCFLNNFPQVNTQPQV